MLHLVVPHPALCDTRQLSWTNLLKKRLPAPWVPKVRGPFDATFFDEQYNEDEEVGAGACTATSNVVILMLVQMRRSRPHACTEKYHHSSLYTTLC